MSFGDSLSSLFGRSPIKPIQKHFAICHQCNDQLVVFFDAALKLNWDEAIITGELIINLENQADLLSREIRQQLPSSLFLSIPREDLLNLLRNQNLIANTTRQISDLVGDRELEIPPSLHSEFSAYIKKVNNTIETLHSATNELDELIESGFGQNSIKIIEAIFSRLNELTRSGYLQKQALCKALHSLEKELPPVETLFLYKVIDQLNTLANTAAHTGYLLQTLVTR